MFDYKEQTLAQRGTRICRLQVVGIIAEVALMLAYRQRKGIGNVKWYDCGTSVAMYDVKVGERFWQEVQVKVHREDAELAIQIAKHFAHNLQERRFSILGARVLQHDADGNRVGEHDSVCERFAQGSGPQEGLHSVELRCRTILCDTLRPKVREQLRTAAGKLWKEMILDDSKAWRPRIVVLFEFDSRQATAWKAVRGDILSLGNTEWQGLFRWAGAS